MKKCTKCQIVKPESEFQLHNGGRIGSRCKKCAAETQRERYNENKKFIQLRRSVLHTSRRVNELLEIAKQLGVKIHLECDGEFKMVLEK